MAKKQGSKSVEAPDFRFRELAGGILLTNDFGGHVFLSRNEFGRYRSGKLASGKSYEALVAGGFVKDRLGFETLFSRWKSANGSVFHGTGLHIFVMTLRCNHRCLYCQSSVVGEKSGNVDMSPAVAKKSVDLALQTPRSALTIEFQGGEPLVNWSVLREAVRYAKLKEKKTGKKLTLALVSNFSLMDEEKARFLLENEVSICTSLDGPESIHNGNRTYGGGNSHKKTVKWIKYFKARHDSQNGLKYRVFKPSALLTVSKRSLDSARAIVDEYLGLGLEEIFIRPLAPIGYAKKHWDIIGYAPEDFLKFYEEALRYIIKKSAAGAPIKEKFAQLLLTKALGHKDSGYLDMRCPCGASIGQLAYNYNGDVYTCDEGRMVGWLGDDIFKVGTVRDKYEAVVSNATTRTVCASSNLESQPLCFRCAYKPYCGVCPVYNYETQGSIWGRMPSNYRCRLMTGVLDLLFGLLQDAKSRPVLEKWAGIGESR